MHARQAITTKYIGASNTKGSRIKASCAAHSLTIHYDSGLNSKNNHAAAASALIEKMGWKGKWHMGGMPDDRGYCFVCADDHPTFVTTAKA